MKRKTLAALLVSTLALVLFGCPPGETGSGAAGTGDILVGEYGSLTGGTATFGQSTHQGIQMAVDEINAAGGIKGRKIKLFTEDDQSKPEEAANAVTKLISQNNVVAIIGEVASSRSLAAAPICQSNKVPMISPSSTNPKVTQVGNYIFRVCYLDSFQGEALANFVYKQLGLKKAALLRDVKNDYSIGLSEFFKNTYTKLGGQIVVDQSYAEGDSDFRAQLTAIRAANPDIIFCPGYYTEMGQISIQARDLGIKQPFAGGDGWESPKLIGIGGENMNGSYYSNHYFADDPAESVKSFVANFQTKYGVKPDALAALGYDSMKLLALAMSKTANVTKDEIRDEIAKVTDFPGVTGNITIGPDRDAVKSLVVLGIENKQLKLVSKVSAQGEISAPDSAAAAPATTATTSTMSTTATTSTTITTATTPTPASATTGSVTATAANTTMGINPAAQTPTATAAPKK